MAWGMLSNQPLTLKTTITTVMWTGATFEIYETGIVLTKASIVFRNKLQLERLVVDIATDWVCTIVLRGLDQSQTKTEVPANKKERTSGAEGYITVLAFDLVDKDNTGDTQVLAWGYNFTWAVEFDWAVTIDSTLTASVTSSIIVNWKFKWPTVADVTARNLLYPTPIDGNIVQVESIGIQYYKTSAGGWQTLWVSTPTPDATEAVKGKAAITSNAEAIAATDDTKMMTALKTKALIDSWNDYTLWETISARDNVSLLPDWLAYKYIGDWATQTPWFTGTLALSSTIALSSTTVVHVFANTAWLIQCIAGTVSDNTITYWSIVSFTPTLFSGGAVFQKLQAVALSSTSYVIWYSASKNTWVIHFDACAYTVSWTTITQGTASILYDPWTNINLFFWSIAKVTSTKFAISYNDTTNSKTIIAGTISWTTITNWTAVWSFTVYWDACYVSDDKIAITDWQYSRTYTFSGTVPSQQNLSLLAGGTIYTSYSYRNIGNNKSLFVGTNSTNTYAIIVDNTTTLPAPWTAVTVLTASTSTDWVISWSNWVMIVTGGNKYYYYTYSWTTLTFINTQTKTNSVNKNNIDQLSNGRFITMTTNLSQVVTNMKLFALWVLKVSWVLNDVRAVAVNWLKITWYTWLTPWMVYYSTSTWWLAMSWDFIIGKASTSTILLVWIPYNTL